MPILAAIDNDPGCENVVRTAHEMGEKMDHPVVVLYIVPEGDDPDRAEDAIRDLVESAVGTTEGIEIRVVPEHAHRDLPTGRIAQNILTVAEDIDPDYLVIGSRKRTPIGKVILGSVSQLILSNAEVPVVTVEQTKG
ncbi:MAG: universal stress protein [Haloplanus sp.]